MKTLKKIVKVATFAASFLISSQSFAADLGNFNVNCGSGGMTTSTVNIVGAVGDTFTVTNTSGSNACGGISVPSTAHLSWVTGATGVNATFGPQFVGGTIFGANSNRAVFTLVQDATCNMTVTSFFGPVTTFAVVAGAGGVCGGTPLPTVTAVNPSSGSTLGGTAITITGTGLTGATAITVGGAACTSVNVASATSATCTTPAGTAGTASVLVTTAGGTSAANTLFAFETPVVASIPTLSEWAMIFMASLLAMFGIRRMRHSK